MDAEFLVKKALDGKDFPDDFEEAEYTSLAEVFGAIGYIWAHAPDKDTHLLAEDMLVQELHKKGIDVIIEYYHPGFYANVRGHYFRATLYPPHAEVIKKHDFLEAKDILSMSGRERELEAWYGGYNKEMCWKVNVEFRSKLVHQYYINQVLGAGELVWEEMNDYVPREVKNLRDKFQEPEFHKFAKWMDSNLDWLNHMLEDMGVEAADEASEFFLCGDINPACDSIMFSVPVRVSDHERFVKTLTDCTLALAGDEETKVLAVFSRERKEVIALHLDMLTLRSPSLPVSYGEEYVVG